MTSSTRKNLFVDVQGSNDEARPGGAPVERILTIRNRGSVTANVDLWIRSNDAKPEPLLRWCTLAVSRLFDKASSSLETMQKGEQGFSGLRLLQLEPQTSREVTLRFDIPSQAEPGFYSYEVVAQAPEYPGEQSQRTQQLRILTAEQDVGLRFEPSWALNPLTSSENPYSLQAGGTLQIKVTVKNRSDAVDRFHLSCPELDPEWFEPPLYPESNPELPGLTRRADGLMLNPGESGDVILMIHPPQHTLAGHYSSTIRLTSFNRENLVLLDIIYLKVEINDRLTIALQPPLQKVPSSVEDFHLFLNNPGNTIRMIGVNARDQDEVFVYSLKPGQIQLEPGQSQTIVLKPTPKKWWRRSWRGKEQEIIFGVNLVNAPLFDESEPVKGLYLPNTIGGKILWQSRPTWILQLLKFLRLLLFLTLILLVLAGVSWLVLRELVLKPSLEPKILEFSTTEESYQAGNGNPIRLDWKISNPESNSQALVTYYSSNGSVLLQKNYPLRSLINQRNHCKAGTYQPNVMLRLVRRLYHYEPSIQTVTCVGIVPQPSIPIKSKFSAGEYQAVLDITPQDESNTNSNSRQIKSFDSRSLKNIKLTPASLPEILYFYSKTQIYRQQSLANSVDSSETLAKDPSSPIQMNWVLSDSREVEAIEVGYVHVAPTGAIESKQVRYTVQNSILSELKGLCRLQGIRLICENVPTQATAPGKYTFTLNVLMSQGETRISKNSEPIEVRPPLPEIRSFKVNGTDVLQNSQVVQMINPTRGPVNLALSWEVADTDRVKVELLPAPGKITPLSNTFMYTLSPTPGSTTLTLQVTNQSGEMVSRSVVIQTAAFPPPPSPLPVPPSSSSNSPSNSTVPNNPINPNQLQPFESPPRAN